MQASRYERHIQRVRAFVQERPWHRLVDLDIEAENASRIMASAFGVNASCWKRVNSNTLQVSQKDAIIHMYRQRLTYETTGSYEGACSFKQGDIGTYLDGCSYEE